MPTLDSQVHAYERNHPGRPWAGTLVGPAEVTGDDMVAAMDAVGVDGALLVSPFSMYRYDASYAVEVYKAHPTRFRLIKPVDTRRLRALLLNVSHTLALKEEIGYSGLLYGGRARSVEGQFLAPRLPLTVLLCEAALRCAARAARPVMIRLILKPGRDESVRRRHPWLQRASARRTDP